MKISIIIPVYNVKEFLSRCLDSIRQCKEEDYEVILVDDGSTDGSSEICDSYVQLDNRFKVIHKKNEGVSSARNIGLQNVRGEWVFFVDSDDYVDNEYLSIDDYEADIIEKSYSVIKGTNITGGGKYFSSNSLTNIDDIRYYFVNKRTNALWNKAFKHSVIRDIKFHEGVTIGEDFLYYLAVIKEVKKYSFSAKGCYYYCERNGSAMQKIDSDFHKKIKLLFGNIPHVKEITSGQNFSQLQTGILYTTYCYNLYSNKDKLSQEDTQKMESLFCELLVSKNRYITKKGKIKMIILHYLYRFKHLISKTFIR